MLLAICNYDFFENDYGPILRLVCRNENQERIFIDIQDESLAPYVVVRVLDMKLFQNMLRDTHYESLIINISDGLPTEYEEPTKNIYATFPRQIREIRYAIEGIQTYNADIEWDKMVIQRYGWKGFIEVDDELYDEYGFTPLNAISPSDKVFKVIFNICYWDIETNGSATKGKQFADCRFAPIIPIISYSTFSKKEQTYVYYGCMSIFKPQVYEDIHKTQLGDRALGMPTFEDYPSEFPLKVKLFNDEKLMHQEFIIDFSYGEYDGLMTFNGRGGMRIVRQKRKWFTGFDFPMFYERCVHLGLYKLIHRMSPIPAVERWGKIRQESVTRRIRMNEFHTETSREYFIKCIPQHDLLYDDGVLFYSKNEHEMKRHNLDTYLSHFLGFKKVEHGTEMVWELMKRNWQKEMRYNIVDVEGMVALDILFGYTDDVAGRALAYGGKIEDGVYASKLHDHIKLWFVRDQYVLPTREYGRKIQRQNQWQGLLAAKSGGYNHPVLNGVYGYHKVQYGFIIDFSKLYPSCSRSVNADTKTKINLESISFTKKGLWLVDRSGEKYLWNDCTRSPSGFFRKDIDAIDTVIYNEMIELRKHYSKLAGKYAEKKANATTQKDKDYFQSLYSTYYAIQFSYKGLINGKYGADGMEGTRSFDLVVYNTPPSMGQEFIKFVIEWLDHRGYKCLLASTDSAIGLARSSEMKVAWNEIQSLTEQLNKDLGEYAIQEFNIKDNYINIGCEKLFNVAVIYNKRQYMLNTVMKEEGGRIIELKKPEAYFRGMEYVRRSSSSFTHDVQKKLMDMVRYRIDKEKMFEYIRKVDESFERQRWEYICGRGGLSNNIDESTGQNYEGARNANKYLGKQYDAGNNPLLSVFIKHPLYYKGQHIPPGELPLSFDEVDEFNLKKAGFDIEYEHLKQVHLVSKVEPLLQLLFGIGYIEAINGDDINDI